MDIKSVDKKFFIDTLLPFILLSFCFIYLYHNVIADMVKDWMTDDNYSHGFMIPLISGFLIWENREKLAKAPISPSNFGAFLLLGGLAFFILTSVGAELFTMRFSMLIVLFSLVIFLLGWGLGKELYVPILYLFFMIPLPAIIWNKIAFPLKLFATTIATMVVQWIGIAIYREGNIIHLANTTLEVVDACSGLRSLTALLALSAAFALITDHSKTKKWILFLTAIPIAISLNVLRLTATAILAEYYGEQVAQGFLHEMSGIIVFLLALVLFYAIHLLMQKYPSKT